jgi:hypothetical protein
MGIIARFRTGVFYIVHWNFQLFCFILVISTKTNTYQKCYYESTNCFPS